MRRNFGAIKELALRESTFRGGISSKENAEVLVLWEMLAVKEASVLGLVLGTTIAARFMRKIWRSGFERGDEFHGFVSRDLPPNRMEWRIEIKLAARFLS